MKAISDFFAQQGIDPFLAGFIAGAMVVGLLRISNASRRSETLVDGTKPMLGGAVPAVTPKVAHSASLQIEITHNDERRSLSADQNAAIQNALSQGNKIEAIKLLREATGLDLKAAKDLIDRLDRA